MTYEILLTTETPEAMLNIITLGDLKSVEIRGFPIRSFAQIKDSVIPDDDEMSEFSDRMIALALSDHKKGVIGPKINGLMPDACIAFFEEICDESRMVVMRDVLEIEREFEILAGL